MKNIAVTALIMLSAMSAASHAQQDPEEERMPFKSMRLGMTLAELQGEAKLKCAADKAKEFDQVCIYANVKDQTYGGALASSIVFGLFDGKLDTVRVLIPGSAYSQAKRALDGKFGEVTASAGLTGIATYMMNGDRAHLMFLDGHQAAVLYLAASGAARRAEFAAHVKRETSAGI